MKVQYGKGLANHSDPESYGGAREGTAEALTGETGGSAIEPRNQKSGTPTLLSEVEGNTREYEKILPQRVIELHRIVHAGAYRATPSRRVYIPKADGRQRPLGIASD